MTLRARWMGPSPRIGDYLMSEVRPRGAYRVEQVIESSPNVGWDPIAKAEVRQLRLVVSRVAAGAVPKHAQVHAWKWDRREARRKAA